MQRMFISLIAVIALLAMAAPVLAGGWATVRLDEPPGNVLAGKPWRFGFMVLQHDVSPNSDVTPIVRAVNRETGEEVTATAVQEGAIGHFVAELTLPQAGEWKWEIRPEPFAETAFQTLNVVDQIGDEGSGLPASLNVGSCADLGDVSAVIDTVAAKPMSVKSADAPVAIGTGVIEMPLSELVAEEHAISVTGDAKSGTPLVCGDVAGTLDGDELAIGLQPAGNSDEAGIAILRSEGDQTAVSLYLLSVNAPSEVPGKNETIEIQDNWIFAPDRLEVAVGTTVTWINKSDLVHMVTGENLTFDDSGPIDPGESFSMTFSAPGAYRYHCSPHPGMEGVVVVS